MIDRLPRLLLPIVAGLFLALLTGCNTTARRISAHESYFNTRPIEVQETIREGNIRIGFQKKDVFLALGSPDAKYSRVTAEGESEVWAYRTWYPAHRGFAPYRPFSYYGYGRRYRAPYYDPWYWHHDRVLAQEAHERLRIVFENGEVSAVERLENDGG